MENRLKVPGHAASLMFIAALGLWAADAHIDIYTAKELQNMGEGLAKSKQPFAARDLARYGNHYTLLAFREATGSSEVHEHEADIFVVQTGRATLVTGGKLVNPHIQKEGEIRGTSISGGERHKLEPGDIIHIPAGVPHQLLIENAPFEYFTIKVTGQ